MRLDGTYVNCIVTDQCTRLLFVHCDGTRQAFKVSEDVNALAYTVLHRVAPQNELPLAIEVNDNDEVIDWEKPDAQE